MEWGLVIFFAIIAVVGVSDVPSLKKEIMDLEKRVEDLESKHGDW